MNPFYEAAGWEPPALDRLYQPGDYALSFTGVSRAELSIDADESLACGADHDNAAPPYDIVDGDMVVWRGGPGDASRDRGRRSLGKKADPSKTYVIDVGFVVDTAYWNNGWPEWIPEGVRHSTEIYQRSGVNVELRVPAIVRYQDYKHYNNGCQQDFLGSKILYAHIYSASSIQWAMIEHYGIDLYYDLVKTQIGAYCGLAATRNNGISVEWARILSRLGAVDVTCSHGNPLLDNGILRYNFVYVLAHEIGHNLGLDHSPTRYYDYHFSFHPSGYGYLGEATVTGDSTITYGTIMAIEATAIPFFSSDRALPKEEVCDGDVSRYDYVDGFFTLCPKHGQSLVGDSIRLGGKVAFDEGTVHVDASEAMQYTIEDASKYACRPGSC